MVKLIHITFLLSLAASSDDSERIVINGKITVMKTELNSQIALSENCFPTNKKPACLAYQAIAKSKSVKIDSSQLIGGKNPGAVMCKLIGGKVSIGLTDNKDEYSVCGFNDDSFIDCGSL